MNIIEQYKFNKTKIKILKTDIEIYKNNYLNLDEEECIKMLNKFNIDFNELTEFNRKFDVIYESLNENEKFFIEKRYFKGKSIKEISEFYSKNQNLIPTISPYRKQFNKPKSLHTIKIYLCKLNKKIILKLERGI